MARPRKNSLELRKRAIRMVVRLRPDYPSEHQAVAAVAQMLGIGSAETLRTWMRQVDADTEPATAHDFAADLG